MATMGFHPYDTMGVHVVHLPSIDTATIKKGDAVYLNAGVVTVLADGTTAYGVFGVAAADSTTTSFSFPVYLADPKTVWVGEADATTTAAYPGQNYGLIVTSNNMAVSIALTSNTLVKMVGLHPADGATTGAGGRVLFQWKPSAIQGNEPTA